LRPRPTINNGLSPPRTNGAQLYIIIKAYFLKKKYVINIYNIKSIVLFLLKNKRKSLLRIVFLLTFGVGKKRLNIIFPIKKK